MRTKLCFFTCECQKTIHGIDSYISIRRRIKVFIIIFVLAGLRRPLTLVLDSTPGQPLSWHLDLSELRYATRPGEASPPLRHTIILTNDMSDIYSEQVRPETFLNILRRTDLAKPVIYDYRNPNTSSTAPDLQEWQRRLETARLGHLGFLVAFRSGHSSRGSEDSRDPKIFNAVDLQLPELRAVQRRGVCEAASPERLSRLVRATLESPLDAGFSACRSQLWENIQDPKKVSRRFLELLEFASDFSPQRRRSAEDNGGLTLRLVAPPEDTPGAASRIVIAIFAWRPFEIQLDTRAVRRRIEVIVSCFSVDSTFD